MHLAAAFLLVVVGLVLLLACTNLATFLLARGTERRKEVAMRLALGAGRRRLIQQLLTETVLLGLAGGVLGLFLARVTLAVVLAYQPPIPVSLSLDLGLDRTVFLFTLALSTLAGIVFGLLPALQSTRPDVAGALKSGGGGSPRGRLRLQTGLVGLQMTVSMILLVGGGIFLRSLFTAQRVDPGFSTEDAGIAWIDLSASGISREEREGVWLDLEERILAEPGIREVAMASHLPLSLGNSFQGFRIPGVDPPPGQSAHRIDEVQVAPGYFRVMGIPILAGRPFGPGDRGEAPDVVLVNQAMDERFWPGENPIGKQIFTGFGNRPWTVVGLAADTKIRTLGEPPAPFVYFPMAQVPPGDIQILARGGLPEGEIVAALRRVIREAAPNLVVMEIKTMKDHLAVRLFGYRSAAALLSVFGVLALLLSSLGLYGVVSFSVSRRVREMGIRLSLGAERGQVTRLVVGQALRVVVTGGAVGVILAVLLARLVRAFLLGVSPADPVTLVGVPLLLGGVALVAAYAPARRASRVNPVEALRSD
jgi:predicted permease